MRRTAFAALAALALAACGKGCSRTAGGPIDVAPLPEPPALQVAHEAFPGAGGELAVVAARPQGPTEGEIRPTITFSKPIVAMGSVEQEKGLPTPIAVEPRIEGEWRWLGSATTELVPKKAVPYATSFTVTVPKGLRAVDGSVLAEPYSFTFETPRPTVQHVEPRPDEFRWLTPRHTISVTFDQPVKDVAAHLRLDVGWKDGWPFDVKEVRLADERPQAAGGRRSPDAFAEARGFRDRRTRYEVTPSRPMPLDAKVELRVEGALQGAEGPLALENPPRWRFRTYGPFKVEGVDACWWDGDEGCPRGPVRVRTTNRADLASLKAALTITPRVELDWDDVELEQTAIVLPAVFRPGTEYAISIGSGARDEHGQGISKPFRDDFETDDLPAEYDLGGDIALLEAKGDGALPVTATNVRRIDLKVVPLDPAALARALAEERKDEQLFAGASKREIDVSAPRNRSRTAPLPLRDMLAGRSNLFALLAEAPDVKVKHRWQTGNRVKRVLGQITDVAVHAKLGATRGVVWVTRLSDGKPVPGARLALHDDKGAVRWRGAADGEGLAFVPGLATLLPAVEDEDGRFALVAAESGGDVGVTLSTWSGGLDPSAFDLPTDWEGNLPRPLGGVFAERGIYRPGDTVHVKGIVRSRKLGRFATPSGGSVQLEVKTSRARKIFEKTVPLTAFGTFSADVKIEADAPLGGYAMSATFTTSGKPLHFMGTFRVEEYRAPQFKVDVVAPEKQLVAGDPVKGQVLARYLFGGAMPRAAVRWTVARESTAFEPPGNAGFAFGRWSWGWDDEVPDQTADVAASGEGETDAMGVLSVAAGAAEATGGRTFAYTIEAEVTDVNRQRIANRAALTVHPASAYAGVRRRATGFAEAGKRDVLEIVAAAPDGARRKGVRVEVAVKRREWKWIRKKGVGGRWIVESEPVEEPAGECDVVTQESPVECAVTPARPGLYVAVATLADEKGRKQTTRFPFYAVGSGWVSWQREETDRLDLVPDKRKYEPGEVAKVLVKSPYPQAEAVLTIEREGVLAARRVRLSGAATTLEVPIVEEHVPNVFVSVVVVRGRVPSKDAAEAGADAGRPEVRIGYARLDVEKRSKRLAVAVAADAAEKRPRDRVTVAVHVTDHRGAGALAEVTVWAVDEGVLRLTGYQPPDPVEMMHPPRGISVRVGEAMLHLVERKRYGTKGESAGGGGGIEGAGSGFRSQFKTTVLFAPQAVTDAEGRAKVAFDLPDNLTTYRIMAVAVSKGDRMGVGESKVAVAKPLMALPALPRLARTGDRFEAGVVVHAPTGRIREVDVRAEAKGLVLEGAATRHVSLDGAEPREVRFTFRAAAPGEAVLRFAASGGGERDGVEQRFPVRLPVEVEAVATYGDTRDVRREAILPPGGVRPDVGGLEVSLASTALGGFSENMRQLVEYPYGCLEQLASRLVPFVALREIQGKFGLGHEPGEKPGAPPAWARAFLGEEALRIHGTTDPDEVVRRTVKAIEALQNPDGGYRYWTTSDCSAEWASSYAVLALGRAGALGYPVDAEALRRGREYVAGTVAAGRCTRCYGYCAPPSDATRAFALYALARTGAPKASYYGDLFRKRRALPLFAQAMLADAMFVGGGDRGDARRLLQEILNHAKETPGEVHLEETDPHTYATLWSSDTRTTGIALATLTDVMPDHPHVAKMAAYLGKVRRGDGRFRNTQEAAFALMALAEVARTKERETPSFTARVTLGGKELAAVPFEGRSTEVKSARLAMKDMPAAKQPLPLDVKRDGKAGVLYYGALLRYAPAAVPAGALERGIYVQRWLEPYEGGGQIRAARAGDLVRVRVRIGSAQERHFVAVSVPVPAGLEIVDSTLATAASAGAAARRRPQRAEPSDEEYELETADEQSDGEEEEDPWLFRFWSPFVFEERRDDRLVLFADHLPPGLHVASFVARATTPGKFALSSARAEEMYSPEVFGRSDAGTFEVVASPAVARR